MMAAAVWGRDIILKAIIKDLKHTIEIEITSNKSNSVKGITPLWLSVE